MSAVISDGKTATLLLPNQASPTDRFAVGRDGGAWTGADTFLLYLLIAAGATPAKQPVGGVSADAGFVAVDPETGTCWIIDPASAVSVAFSAITGNASDNTSLVNYVTSRINALIASAPGALDTLDELAAALGDDANFASTVTTALAGKASSVHTHTFSQITDGQEAVEDYIATALLGGTQTGITVTYTDNGSGAGVYNFVVADTSVGLTDGTVSVSPVSLVNVPPGCLDDDGAGVVTIRFALSQVTISGTSATLGEAADGTIQRTTNGSAVAIELDNAAPAGTQFAVVQIGAGQVTFTAEAGGSLHNRAGHTKTAGQYATVSLYVDSNSGTNAVWVLSGDTAA